jgi:hypothetical protein
MTEKKCVDCKHLFEDACPRKEYIENIMKLEVQILLRPKTITEIPCQGRNWEPN